MHFKPCSLSLAHDMPRDAVGHITEGAGGIGLEPVLNETAGAKGVPARGVAFAKRDRCAERVIPSIRRGCQAHAAAATFLQMHGFADARGPGGVASKLRELEVQTIPADPDRLMANQFFTPRQIDRWIERDPPKDGAEKSIARL